MKLSGHLNTLCNRAMIESLGITLMVALVRQIIPNYDLHERTGFPQSMPISKQEAAAQILKDINDIQMLLPFIALIVETHASGYMGRQHPVMNIREILHEMLEQGFIYDQEYKMFFENSSVQRTHNFGVLRDGEEYNFTFLRMDIVNNTTLVRHYTAAEVDAAFADIREIVQKAVNRRNGRIWSWEGDGGLVSFYFSQKNINALLCGMEIVHEVFLYNLARSHLDRPIAIRMAVHAGPCEYTDNIEDLKRKDTIKNVMEIESAHTPANTLTISNTVWQTFDDVVMSQLSMVETGTSIKYYSYALKWES